MLQTKLMLDIVESIGAPCPTAVVSSKQSIPDHDLRTAIVIDLYMYLLHHNYSITKFAFVAPMDDPTRLAFEFVQVCGVDSKGTVIVETGGNCGNSMVAAAAAVLRRNPHQVCKNTTIQVINQTTALTFDIHFVKHVKDRCTPGVVVDLSISCSSGNEPGSYLFGSRQPCWYVWQGDTFIPITTINFVNPYILVSAQCCGIPRADDLLSLESAPERVLHMARAIRSTVIATLGLPRESQFPKIALVDYADSQETLFARTLYLRSWHPGLPLTGALSLALAALIPGSILERFPHYPSAREFMIQTPKESLCIETRLLQGSRQNIQLALKNRSALYHYTDGELSTLLGQQAVKY